jgi:anti-sigma28 factor (negative regulator of flagellin synthesis)
MGLGKLVAKLTKKGAKDGSSKVIEADTHEVDSAPVVLGPTEAEPIDRKILESADNITAISEPRLVLGPVSRNGSIPRTAEQTTPEAKPDSQSVPRSDQKPKTEVKHDSDIRDAKVASISSNLWDKAYDSIKDDEKQTGLVTSYEKLLSCFIQDDPKAENNLISQEDSKTRSEQFKSVMERGLERAHSSRTNKVAKAIGGGAEWISNFKDVIGLGVSTTPQAAIPWAAVSLSLEVRVIF